MRICIVSPHLDDALLSCGVLMQRHLAKGDDVLVLNIFSAGTNSENRKKEDLNAQKLMGARPYYLDELDAPDRNPAYKSLKELFFGPLDQRHEEFVTKITKRVSDFFAEHKVDVAAFPLAAGTHIDHRIAFEAGRRVKNTQVKFYEDRPYILLPGVLEGRKKQIGSDAAMPKVTKEIMKESSKNFHYLKHFHEGDYHEQCLPHYMKDLDRPSAEILKTESETLIATSQELKKIYDCLSRYESEMRYIYPSYDAFMEDSLAYEKMRTGESVYAERSWTFK